MHIFLFCVLCTLQNLEVRRHGDWGGAGGSGSISRFQSVEHTLRTEENLRKIYEQKLQEQQLKFKV